MYDVDWGDEKTDIEVAGSISHDYEAAGDYTVKVTGSLPGIQVNMPPWNASKLISIDQWGAMPWVTMRDAFKDATKLSITATDTLDLTAVTDCSRMFSNCSNLNHGVGHWDMSNIEDMSEMFAGCTKFNQDLSDWDVVNVTTMNEMFNGASAFDQSLGDWEIPNVVEISDMLINTGMSQSNYDSTIIGWANYATGQGAVQMGVEFGVTGLQYCASDVKRQELIDNYNWVFDGDIRVCRDEAFVTTLRVTSSISSIRIFANDDYNYNYMVDWENDGIIDEYNVTGNIQHGYTNGEYEMAIYGEFPHFIADVGTPNDFGNTIRSLEIIDINQWGAIAWKSMQQSFANYTLLEYSALDTPDLSEVNSMQYMFFNCTSFNGNIVDWDVIHVKNMSHMFNEATAFSKDIGSWDVDSVTDMSNMFHDATSFNGDITGWNVGSVTNMSEMFYNATSFQGFLGGWDVSNVTDMSGMFRGAEQFNASIAGWEVGNVTNMSSMFNGVSLFNFPLEDWDVSQVEDMSHMFDGASSFDQAIGEWDVSHVLNMEGMFQVAESFNQDISQWNTGQVQSMSAIFEDAKSFNQDISNWNTSQVTDMSYMFYGAESFNQPLGNWNTSNSTTFYATFEDALSFDQSLEEWDITSANDMDNMLSETNLSVANYDKTLISWANQDVHSDIYLGVEGISYCNSEFVRQKFIDDYGWFFDGDSKDCTQSNCGDPKNYIGPDNGDWNTAANWSQASIPDACDYVLIGTDKSVRLSAEAECYLLNVSDGASLEVNDFELTVTSTLPQN